MRRLNNQKMGRLHYLLSSSFFFKFRAPLEAPNEHLEVEIGVELIEEDFDARNLGFLE
jgi:hypothetical protein